MAISPADILVVYRSGNADSLACAQRYQLLHGLDSSQLLAVPCSGNEVLADHDTFVTEVENTVLGAVVNGDVKCIVVCYGVPGGFRDGGDVISTTSRLSRVNYPFSKNLPNPLFGRTDLDELGDDEYEVVIPCSRIDAPTLGQAKGLIDRAEIVLKQGVANGRFYIDPYPPDIEYGTLDYTDELTEFVSRTLPLLRLETVSTVSADPYEDLVFPFVEFDSFMWACGADKAGHTFFGPTNAARIFLYNADTDSAVTVRDPAGNRWPSLAIANGYAATAGSMSLIGPTHYLRPRPFFHALMQGMTVGEAYLMSVPYLDSPETLFGDPLLACRFPVAEEAPLKLDPATATTLILDELAAATACLSRREKLAEDIRRFTTGADVETAIDLLYPANDFYKSLAGSYTDDVRPALIPALTLTTAQKGLLASPSVLDGFVAANGYKVPQLLADAYNAANFEVSTTRVAVQGTWHADFPLQSLRSDKAVLYHFELQIATDEAFTVGRVTKDSAADPSHWLYQREVNVFEGIPSAGVPSSYAGRVIRYEGDGLTRAGAYYIRFRQKVGGTTYGWVSQKLVVST